ncbi:MAG TPA: hypothetical protein VFG12_07455, partial [Rhodopila sp.]|nr:hypothetical protein [Rhodopila sp.]
MSDRLPLLPAGPDVVARQEGKLVSRARFLAEIEELAGQLPDRAYVVNFCADRYRFAVALAAAMLRGQVTLLPTGRDSTALSALRQDYPALYVLGEDGETSALKAPFFAFPRLAGTHR